jgi:hypothetical protein
MTNQFNTASADLAAIEAINAVVDNYNEHKSEKNKELTTKEVRIIAIVDTPHYEEFLLITGRNDGLIYSLQVERISKKVSLYLYNRIARKILHEGIQLAPAEVEIQPEGEDA